MVTQLDASAMISPFFTMTAPKGPPPFFTLSSESVMALIIKSLFSIAQYISCCKGKKKNQLFLFLFVFICTFVAV
jgi:hypothetical protein